MKKVWIYSGLFLLAYVFFLVINIPAVWVVEQVKSPQGVDIKSTQGTIWHAHFDAIKLPENLIVYNVEVRLSFWSLLLFNPQAELNFGGNKIPGPRGNATLDNLFSEVRLTDVNIEMRANDVLKNVNLPVPVQAHNRVQLKLAEFQIGSPVCSSTAGSIQWPNAKVTAFEQSVELGSLEANLSCDKGELIVTMNPQNRLGLSYELVVSGKNRFSGNGHLKPGNDFPETLEMALPFLGKTDNQGRYRLRF